MNMRSPTLSAMLLAAVRPCSRSPAAPGGGDRLNHDRDGLRADLFGHRDVSLEASLGIGLPVRNSNRARSGMPHLHLSLQAGPRLNWRMFEGDTSDWTVSLPARGVMDVKGHVQGLVSEPELRIRILLPAAVGIAWSFCQSDETEDSDQTVF